MCEITLVEAGTEKTAIERACELLGVMADAGRRADQALRSGRISYDPHLGFADRNLLYRWLVYAAFSRMRPRPFELGAARDRLRRAIAEYRDLRGETTVGLAIGRAA